jgi:hypothetical protein
MTIFLFTEFIPFFKRYVPNGFSKIKNNRENVRIWFKLITLSFHMSHALQPLIVSCFKPFKITFRKERDAIIMAKGKYNK